MLVRSNGLPEVRGVGGVQRQAQFRRGSGRGSWRVESGLLLADRPAVHGLRSIEQTGPSGVSPCGHRVAVDIAEGDADGAEQAVRKAGIDVGYRERDCAEARGFLFV